MSGSLVFIVEVILNHDDFLTSIGVCLQDPLNCCVFTPSFSSGDVPRIADHELEVVIVINAGADILVVVLELLDCDDSVLLVGLPDGHEVHQYLILSLPSALEIWVEVNDVGNLDVLDGHLAASVLVQNCVGLVNHV